MPDDAADTSNEAESLLPCFACPKCGRAEYALDAPFCEKHGLRVKMRPCSDDSGSGSGTGAGARTTAQTPAHPKDSEHPSDDAGNGGEVSSDAQGGSVAQ